jgi:hypothetical protein
MDLESYRETMPYEFAVVGLVAYLAVEGPKRRALLVAPICFLLGVLRLKLAILLRDVRDSDL